MRLCVELDRLRHHPAGGHPGDGTGDGGGGGQSAAAPDTTRAWEAVEQAIIGKAVDLLSGPGGLASFLRRRQLGARLGGPSLPLDIGYCETIPASIRNAVILRDRTASGPDGATSPPRRAKSTTSRTRRTAARPASKTACSYAGSIIRW